MLRKTRIELLCADRRSCRTELLLIKSSNYVLHHWQKTLVHFPIEFYASFRCEILKDTVKTSVCVTVQDQILDKNYELV